MYEGTYLLLSVGFLLDCGGKHLIKSVGYD